MIINASDNKRSLIKRKKIIKKKQNAFFNSQEKWNGIHQPLKECINYLFLACCESSLFSLADTHKINFLSF